MSSMNATSIQRHLHLPVPENHFHLTDSSKANRAGCLFIASKCILLSWVSGKMIPKSFMSKKCTVVKSQSGKVKKERSGTLPHWINNDTHLVESIREVMKLGIQMMESTKDSATPRLKHPVVDLIVAGLNRKVGKLDFLWTRIR